MLIYIEHVEFVLIYIVYMGTSWCIDHIGPINGPHELGPGTRGLPGTWTRDPDLGTRTQGPRPQAQGPRNLDQGILTCGPRPGDLSLPEKLPAIAAQYNLAA